MKRTIISLSIFAIGLLLQTGCATAAASAESGETSARYAGDRASIALEEVVASVPVEGGGRTYQNLHVALTAIINPRKATFYDPTKVESIIRRLEPRMAAEVLKILTVTRTRGT